RLQAAVAAHRVPLQALRRPPGPRLRRRPAADGPAVVQQRRRAPLRARRRPAAGPPRLRVAAPARIRVRLRHGTCAKSRAAWRVADNSVETTTVARAPSTNWSPRRRGRRRTRRGARTAPYARPAEIRTRRLRGMLLGLAAVRSQRTTHDGGLTPMQSKKNVL